jgi:methylmalonyl-CoA mutase cobalamin-binding subunit
MVGEGWQAGWITAAQEHFFTSLARVFAWNLTRQYQLDARSPQIVVGTPAGQLHDLGAMIVAAAAANRGWRVVFLGANLPSFELVGAVQTTGAEALALSLVHPEQDPGLVIELERLGSLLPPHIRLIVGGRAATGYRSVLLQIGAHIVDSIEQLDLELDSASRLPRRA